MTYSSVVPSCSLTARHSASTSSFDAQRDATGWPSPSECVNESVVEKPSPPASSDSCSSCEHRVELLGRRLVADAVGAHHVAAQRAVADEEPDVERRRCRRARRGSRRSVRQFHGTPVSSAGSGMPSTLAIMRRR